MPAFTIISCAQAVVPPAAMPVLVDSDPRTWSMDVGQVEAKITPRTRAIMPVHIYGHPVDMDPLLELARRHGLAIVEDAAEAHGAEYLSRRNWRRCGSFGELSMLQLLRQQARHHRRRRHGRHRRRCARRAAARRCATSASRPGRRFFARELGFDFRLTNLQAALGVAQLERIGQIVARKRRMGAGVRRRLRV